MIWSLIVGGVLGWLAGLIMGKDIPGGIIGNIIAGFLGSWIGNSFFTGIGGPEYGGFYVIPTLLGTIILIAIVSFIMKRRS